MTFQKGNIPYNKGGKMSDEQKIKVSKAKLGSIPYNKGLPMKQEQRIKLSQAKMGVPNPTKGKRREKIDGDNNPHWKGGTELYRSRYIYKKYGLTTDQYNEMLFNQDSKCIICNKACTTGQTLSIDHDHHTKVVRGLLCRKCNSGIGLFDDSVELLEKALAYLKLYK